MLFIMRFAAGTAGLIHVLIFGFESLWWMNPAVRRRFRQTEEQALATKLLAFNQGFYNLFLGAGVFTGLALTAVGEVTAGRTLLIWSCSSMLAAALVLVFSSPKMARGALIQGLPPLVCLIGAFLGAR